LHLFERTESLNPKQKSTSLLLSLPFVFFGFVFKFAVPVLLPVLYLTLLV
jgi:hypothetical protein